MTHTASSGAIGLRERGDFHAGIATSRATISTSIASLLLAAYVLLLANVSLWRSVWHALAPVTPADAPFVFTAAVMLLMLFWMVFALLGWRGVAKPAWVTLLAITFSAAYFMDSYGLVVDRVAIQSVFETDPREASEWFSARMLPYVVGALLPTLWLLRLKLSFRPWTRELAAKLVVSVLVVTINGAGILTYFPKLSTIARNHRELQHMINPTTVLQSVYGYARRLVAPRPTTLIPVLTDARLGSSWSGNAKRRLLVLVVGESARSSSFSLDGYARDTNPRLAQENVINYADVHSCGTSTAISLPCMFTDLGEANYSDLTGRGRESLLDVLKRAGLTSLWIDNNTGSKNLATRSGEMSVAADRDPNYCSEQGCYDDILVDRLRRLLDGKEAPAVVVLHQKGSHGPSYFERYPPEFRRFTPTCESNELDDCTREEIINTYDNSILYTDHNLGEVINVLRERQDRLDSAMLYVSDHGESTGEKGMYLHGAPLFMAPREQTQIPMVLWLSGAFAGRFGIDTDCLREQSERALSHDVLFHSVLGLLDIQSQGYRKPLDLFAGCRQRELRSQLLKPPAPEA